MMKLSIPIILIILVIAPQAHSASRELATQLADVHQHKSIFELSLKACLQSTKTSPEEFYAANPKHFGGISPSSMSWGAIQRLTNDYYLSSCNYMTSEEFSEHFIKAYMSEYTDGEIQELLQFYSTDLGRKTITANLAANMSLQAVEFELMTRKMAAASKVYVSEIQKLVNRHFDFD